MVYDNNKMINAIKYKLKKLKIKKYLLVKNEFEKENKSRLSKTEKIKKMLLNPKITLAYLTGKIFSVEYTEIVLTTTCTLNCKGCSALMNEYTKGYHTDLEQNIKSLERLLSAIDSLNLLRLLGGEPLCYPNLYEILAFTNQQEKIKNVGIVTNGTLLIKDERILEILKNKKFYVYISNYGKNSRKRDELIEQLKQNNIAYILGSEDYIWRDYGNLECRNRKENELRKQFLECKILCKSIFEGKLHHCPRSSHGTKLGKIPLVKRDYVDLLDENTTQKELRKKLYKFYYGYVPYVEACNYCNNATKDLKEIHAGEQIKKGQNV